MIGLPTQEDTRWRSERVGKVTASRVADVIARTKAGYAAARGHYLAQLVAERLTGVPAEGYTSPAMQWGLEREAEARAAYSFLTDADVEPAGYIPHPQIEASGATPDGLVGDDGLVEFKCPNTSTHIETLITEGIPIKYQVQMLWQMACTGRRWCDFASFDPRLPPSIGLVVIRLGRDDDRIAELEEEVKTFLFELETVLRRISRPKSSQVRVLRTASMGAA